MTEDNSLDKQTSGTAMTAAFLRALAVYDYRKGIKGNDNLAEIFLDDEQKKPLKDEAARALILQSKVSRGIYEFMIARTAFFDQIMKQTLKANIPQIVFLGAGYDSRPYRFEKFIQDTIIFELDTKPTQQHKQDCLRQAQISISRQIRFVPVNFATDNLIDKLVETGFSREKRTLFFWEGVTYYLSTEVVDNMLILIKENTPSGSSICFDYAAFSSEVLNEQSVKELMNYMRSHHTNEPAKFGICAGEIDSFLANKDFEVVEHLTADEMTEKYLSDNGRLDIDKVLSLFCLVHAKVKQ